jgi:hypothetical protein
MISYRRFSSVWTRLVPPKPKRLIFLYHRIADKPVDRWNLSVSPSHFEEQLDVLSQKRYPLSLQILRELFGKDLARQCG